MRQKQRVFSLFLLSPSSRRAWIEIVSWQFLLRSSHVALLTEGVDRNRPLVPPIVQVGVSPSSRRAWIEMLMGVTDIAPVSVALLTEGVDRNKYFMGETESTPWVALLTEGVDRNVPNAYESSSWSQVALLTEGVDRNHDYFTSCLPYPRRPPHGGRG